MVRHAYFEKIEDASVQHPDKIALLNFGSREGSDHKKISYRELNRWSNALAHSLIEVSSAQNIGIYIASEFSYIIALLACAKAGRCFVPLDVKLPSQRLIQLVKKCRIDTVLSTSAWQTSLEEKCDESLKLLNVDTLEALKNAIQYDQNIGITVKGDTPCYIMFTSGSTGEPKAVVGQHKSLVHFLNWQQECFSVDDTDVIPWLAPIGFDVSLRDILLPLLCGATVAIPNEELRMNVPALLLWLKEIEATHIHCVPSLFRLFSQTLSDQKVLPKLRRIFLAGEPLFYNDVEDWRNTGNTHVELINLYGPTETTLAKMFFRITDQAEGMVPIGQALPKTHALIIQNDRLCQPGEIGEIYIRSPYRSLGYLDNDEQTNEVFVQNPLQSEQTDILYKTGDLGRYQENSNNITCLGRLDNQVKINGIRIELGELEVACRKIDHFKEVVVHAIQRNDRSKLLCCYYTRVDGLKEPLATDTLRQTLAQYLPENHLPHMYMCLGKLPKLLNGKVNRKGLPSPEELLYQDNNYVAPRNSTEERLCELWAECLGLTRVSVTTKFADLGGDSLKTMRLLSEIYRYFNQEINLKQWMDNPTVQAIAVQIDKNKNENKEEKPFEDITHAPEADYYPVTATQERLWRLYKLGIAPLAYNLPEAYFITGNVDISALQEALQSVVDRHESLRSVFFEEQGTVYHRVPLISTIKLETASILNFYDDSIKELIEKNQNHSFDLEQGPLLRCKLVQLEDQPRYVLLFNIHHIICDAWSLNIFVKELSAFYQATLSGQSTSLPPINIQFKDYAHWQQQQLDSEHGRESRRWWLKQLNNPLPTLGLPCDYTRPSVQSFNGDTYQQVLTQPVFEKISRLLKTQKVSLFAFLNTAVKILLYRYTGQQDLIVGSPVMGRNHPSLDQQIGYYVNTLPLRDTLNPLDSITDCLDKIQHSTNAALQHQAYPFDGLINELDIPRDMAHATLFDVMLVLQNMDLATPELQGARFEATSQDQGWNFSRYDMVFHFQEGESGLLIDINYNTDIFRPERIARYAEHLCCLLENMANFPSRAIARIPILPRTEKTKVLAFSQGTKKKVDATTNTIPGLFFLVAQRFADNTALVGNELGTDGGISYQTMGAEVRKFAQGLIHLGLQSGDTVALAYDRSARSIIALLGIMSAGGVYMPLDTELPSSRLKTILNSSDCRLIVQASSDEYGICDTASETSIGIFQYQDVINNAEHRCSLPELDPGAAAYMIYTSGSTGTPKGVVLKHSGFINMSLSQIETFNIDSTSKKLQFASLSFDASMANIFMALFSGATLVLVEKTTIEQPQRFLEYLNRYAVNVITLPPVYLRALNCPRLPTIKTLITAGEPANPEDVHFYYSNGINYFNAYGPTEVSVCATIEPINQESLVEDGYVAIGAPLNNVDVYVLDDQQNLAPVGIPGELYVSGEGLALCYYRDDTRTEEAFLKTPEHLSDTCLYPRLYKTGDRAYWNDQGKLIFLGRSDKQLKINGFRVDTAEVENAFKSMDKLESAYVDEIEHSGNTKLAAWLVAKRQAEIWPSVAEFYIYDDVLYGSMAQDSARNAVYLAAFKKVLKNQVVLEIGPGPEVILSRLAISAGAKKVYAVELLEETYRKACAKVESLGLSDRIILIHSDVQNVELPEKAQWCISEIVGSIGGSEGSAKIINNSRHLLHDPSHMLPQRSVTAMAAVSMDHEVFSQGFPHIASHYVNEIFKARGAAFDLRLCVKNLPQDVIISNHDSLETLDYTRTIPLEQEHSVSLKIQRPAKLSGLLYWLQLFVDEEHYIDSLYAEQSWLPGYIPLFGGESVEVETGDILELTVHRSLCENGLNPDFTINGTLSNSTGQKRKIHCKSLHFGDGFLNSKFYQQVFQKPEGYSNQLDWDIPRQKTLSTTALRNQLATKLPSYSIPNFITILDQFPLTINGKIDHKQLPKPVLSTDTEFQQATTEMEHLLSNIWQQVLGIKNVSINDNFLSLGGDSISAIQIIAKLANKGVSLDARDIFQNPVISHLAKVAESNNSLPEQIEISGTSPLSPIQRWAFATMGDNLFWFNQACLLHSPGRLDTNQVDASLTRLITHHDELRASFVTSEIDGSIRQHINQQGHINVEVQPWTQYEYLTDIPEAECDLWHSQFELSALLFKAVILKLKNNDVLLLLANHLVVDTVSWRIIIEDMQGMLMQESYAIPAKTNSFLQWSEYLNNLATLPDDPLNEGYWREMVEKYHSEEGIQTSEQPKVYSRTNRKGLSFTLDQALSESLVSHVKSTEYSMEHVLLTAIAQGLKSLLGSSQNLITMESHGRSALSGQRSYLNVSRTVGWFTYYYPLLLSSSTELANTLDKVKLEKETLSDQGMAYLLLRWLRDDGEQLELSPKVSFNYLGDFNSENSQQLDGDLRLDFDVPGQHIHPNMPYTHSLDCLMMFVKEGLSLSFSYDGLEYQTSQINEFTRVVTDTFKSLNRYLAKYHEQRSTTAEFSVDCLTDTELDDIFI